MASNTLVVSGIAAVALTGLSLGMEAHAHHVHHVRHLLAIWADGMPKEHWALESAEQALLLMIDHVSATRALAGLTAAMIIR